MGDPVRDANANATAAYSRWRIAFTKLEAHDRDIKNLGSKVTPDISKRYAVIIAEEEQAWKAMAAARAALKGSTGGRSRRHRRRHRKTLRRK